MNNKLIFQFIFLIIFNSVCSQESKLSIKGDLKKWHKVTLNFEGEQLSENDEENPFLDYRLNVTFRNGNKTYLVPGFYAADGNSAETSSKNGAIWKVRFTPNEIGEWSYKVSFRKGSEIAVNNEADFGEAVLFDGLEGSFFVEDTDKVGSDFRAKGRLNYVDKRYLQFEGTKDYFLKGGADSPESFLGYFEFDQTPPSHKYEAHREDWKTGDPTWQNGKGKNIIGALNYLASKGMNSVYFLTMNVQGDGKDVWPWNSVNERYRFDCSKLDQWEIVFDHMDKLGLMLHIVTQETENELLLDIGETKTQRKLYYRELIARFSHHLGVTWNLGEENGPVHWSPKGQTDDDRKAMAKYIKENDPYKSLVVLHTHSIKEEQDLYLEPLLRFEYLDGPSMQTNEPNEIHGITKRWILDSQKSDKNWVVSQDEIGPADTGAKPDAIDPEHNSIRAKVLWGNLMAGGAGVEWYFGYKYAHNDLNCEDWRSRDILWEQTKYALDFFQTYLPFQEMKSADDLTDNKNDYVFAQNGVSYVIYMPEVVETKLNLFGLNSRFSIKWYNPKIGGKLMNGTVKKVKGGGVVSIGFPPNKEGDWVALLRAETKSIAGTVNNKKPEVISLEALSDFAIDKFNNEINYYRDEANGVLAINAAEIDYRDKFAVATSLFKGENGMYKPLFVSIAENDGESLYEIRVNGTTVYKLTNPKVTASFKTHRFELDKLYLQKNDIIEVASKAVTNGEIPENNETAWSRGRWSTLLLTPNGLSIKEQLKDMKPFVEDNGFLEVEAEAFHSKTANGTKREWYIRSKDNTTPFAIDEIEDHTNNASENAYIEALPDTRITHDDDLILGENFFPISGVGGVVSYKIRINNPGKYYIWAKAFSSGTEDNGVHVGVNGEWPESGKQMQWCDGKNKWTWSSAQRGQENHCGEPRTIFIEFKEANDYVISFSMREDGFELDTFILTTNPNFTPK